MKALDLDVMTMIVAVADTGTISRAAEVVHRSQSAVSMQIKTLEAALGKPLFVRKPRSVVPTQDGEVLLTYARRMLALRDEAWAAVVRPDVTGRVSIGVPDDYASSLLPPVLGKFAAAHPRVEIRVIGLPSSELVPLLKDNSIDLACMTKTRGVTGEFIRFEPAVWAGSANRKVWKERPLSLAVFGAASAVRALAINALQRENIKYRMSYESPSLMGVLSMVEAGLAVAPLAKCSVPAHLVQLSQNEGLPPLGELEVTLARSSRSARPLCDFLAEQILHELRS